MVEAGLPGQAEEKLAARPAEHQRLPRLDQHAVEKELRAEIRQHLLHHVVFARRNAAGEQQQIRSRGRAR